MAIKIEKKSKMNISIPTSSMPDIIFQLLIFFMVTTVLRQFSGLDVTLPDAKMIKKLPSKRDVTTIWINAKDQVIIDDITVKKERLSQLRTIAYQKLVDNPRLIVSLRVDKNANMGTVMDVQQELRKANTLKINYSTIPEEI